MYSIIDVRGGRRNPVIKSKSLDLIKEAYKAYSNGWGKQSGFIVAIV